MKKILALGSLLLLNNIFIVTKEIPSETKKSYVTLEHPLLRVADNAGLFHNAMIDILTTRAAIISLIQGKKEWQGVVINLRTTKNVIVTTYCRRPEMIFGAAFVVITPDYKNLSDLVTDSEKNNVDAYLTKSKTNTLYHRQMNATNDAVFTGSYAINPITHEHLPIYISDYSMQAFDTRQTQTRLGFPAHNSADFDFAHVHHIPIKIVVTGPSGQADKSSSIALPIIDKSGHLKEAYLGEYRECFITNSEFLNNMNLKDAAAFVIQSLDTMNQGYAHTQLLLYEYAGQQYSIKDLAKIEAIIHKNEPTSIETQLQKEHLSMLLNYAQADFLELVEQFIINIKNTKSLMIAIIEESCSQRKMTDSYLPRWSKIPSHIHEKDAFKADILSLKDLTLFCRDLVNFLDDFAHSCPHALDYIRKQTT